MGKPTAFGLLASTVLPAQAVQIVSNFDKAGLGLDGWTIVGDPAAGSPAYVATGGNPVGFARAVYAGGHCDVLGGAHQVQR